VYRKHLALLTDFGTQDYYVAVLKGVIRQLAPDAEFFDISHNLPSFSPQSASFFLEQSLPYMPQDINGLVVIDPGVGSGRGVLLIKSRENYWIGPDNGCLSHFLKKEGVEVYLVKELLPFFKSRRSSFEARDRMAPLMGRILSGEDPASWCDRIEKEAAIIVDIDPVIGESEIIGLVIHIDHFGNIVTSVKAGLIPGRLEDWTLEVKGKRVDQWVTCYEDIKWNAALLEGSHGYVELAGRQLSAADCCGVDIGDKIVMIKR